MRGEEQMSKLTIREINDEDVDTLIALWKRCGLTRPWNNPVQDIAFARTSRNATVLTGWQDCQMVASAMVGHDGHRGAVYYLSVIPEKQSQGLGRAIMSAAENWLLEKGIGKLNIIVRGENRKIVDFYCTLGYEVEDRVLLARWINDEKKPTSASRH